MARAVMRMLDANKWNKEVLAAVRATPWDLHASKEPEVVFKPSGEDAEKPFEQQATLSRNRYLRADDFESSRLDFWPSASCAASRTACWNHWAATSTAEDSIREYLLGLTAARVNIWSTPMRACRWRGLLCACLTRTSGTRRLWLQYVQRLGIFMPPRSQRLCSSRREKMLTSHLSSKRPYLGIFICGPTTSRNMG